MKGVVISWINKKNPKKKVKIAVFNFVDLDGKTTRLGKFISEELITNLFQTKKFEVVERNLLEKILKEQELSASGMIDEESTKKLGKILGVDAICTGTITDFGDYLKSPHRFCCNTL